MKIWFSIICFMLYNYIIPMAESDNQHEKPVREKTIVPKSPRIKPPRAIPKIITPDATQIESETSNDHISQISISSKPTEVFDESSSSDNEKPINTRTFTRIPLSDDSDSNTYAPPKHSKTPLKKKHRSKTKTKSPDIAEITESINDISETITSTVELVGKNAVMGIVKSVVKSKQFTIILIIGSLFLGIGYLLKIIYMK